MAKYAYKAIAGDSSITMGELEAGSRQEALHALDVRGLRPVDLTEKSGAAQTKGKADGGGAFSSGRVTHAALENFTRQLSNLLTAGVPLSRALQIVGREASSPAAGRQWRNIYERVIDGSSLADAMAQYPKVFPRVYVAMIRSGEAGGFLDVSLRQVADFQKLDRDLKSRALSSLIYPITLAFLCVGVVAFLMIFFIPRFQAIFAGFGAALPWLTQAIMALSAWTEKYGVFLLLAIVISVMAAKTWFQSEEGRRAYERWILRIPVIGAQVGRFAMTRFTRMLGTLLAAGVPLINALRVARASLGNQSLIDAVSESIEKVQKGASLSESLGGCPLLFPGSVLEMISVAEETGRLDEELIRIAEVSEGDLDRQLRTMVALLEPLLLFIMAGLVGTIVVGMLLPIFTLQDYIK